MWVWTMEAFVLWTLDAYSGGFMDNGCVLRDSFGLWMRISTLGISELVDYQRGLQDLFFLPYNDPLLMDIPLEKAINGEPPSQN